MIDKANLESLKQMVKEMSDAYFEMERTNLDKWADNKQRLNGLADKSEEILEIIGARGVPTTKDLAKKLNETNEGVESEHRKLIELGIKSIDDRIKREIARIDLRVSASETMNRRLTREVGTWKT